MRRFTNKIVTGGTTGSVSQQRNASGRSDQCSLWVQTGKASTLSQVGYASRHSVRPSLNPCLPAGVRSCAPARLSRMAAVRSA
jgi:hypothetical protein